MPDVGVGDAAGVWFLLPRGGGTEWLPAPSGRADRIRGDVFPAPAEAEPAEPAPRLRSPGDPNGRSASPPRLPRAELRDPFPPGRGRPQLFHPLEPRPVPLGADDPPADGLPVRRRLGREESPRRRVRLQEPAERLGQFDAPLLVGVDARAVLPPD